MVMYKDTSLANVVKGNTVKFEFYQSGELFYSINVKEDNFLFPVPIEDAGEGIFLASDKAMLFMRYIRKHLVAMEALVAEEKLNEKNYE